VTGDTSDGLWEQAAETAAWVAHLNEFPGPTRLLVMDMAMTSKAEIVPGMSGPEILAALAPPEDGYFAALPWVSAGSDVTDQPGGDG